MSPESIFSTQSDINTGSLARREGEIRTRGVEDTFSGLPSTSNLSLLEKEERFAGRDNRGIEELALYLRSVPVYVAANVLYTMHTECKS